MNLIKTEKLANELLKKHGLINKGWRFEFDNAPRRFGCCKYRSKRITLSKKLTELNDEENVLDTILHEIAHALTPGHHHDSVWRTKALEIGCDGNRCYSSDEVVTPESKYIAKCSGCGMIHKKHRQPKNTSSCGKCDRKYNPTYKLTYVVNPKFV